MKKLKYIYAFLVAVLLGFAVSSCEDDDVVAAEVTDETTEASGETVKTTFTVGISAPDVSADIDPVTRASADSANIEYAKPENGGRFQNIVVVLTDHNNKIYGVHCHDWNDGVGVKEYNVIFSDINVPAADVTNKRLYKVYAFGNICEEHYKDLSGEASAKVGHILNIQSATNNTESTNWPNMTKYCIVPVLTVEDVYKISFSSRKQTYKVGISQMSAIPVTSTGMPVNNSATATVVKGNTQFNVAMKRVCARLQVTFRNFTGKTDYDDTYYGTGSKGNRVYVDNFVIKNVLATSTSYFYNGSAPSSTGSVNFDILQVLGGSNDHDRNKIENGEDLVVSMYVFENKAGKITEGMNQVQKYQYDLKVDRGKSLGNRAESLQDDNVYVMWNDNLDENSRDWKNKENYCLGADGNSIKLVSMDNSANIPYGTGEYGNRVFWRYKDKKLESCNVNLTTDFCNPTGLYMKSYDRPGLLDGYNKEYPTSLSNNAQTFTDKKETFDKVTRTRLNISGSFYLQISKDKLYTRMITGFENSQYSYPWVFFAKYIIKNGETFSTGTGSNKTTITQIERNHSYELDFSVMPNYDTKQEILVNCVRKQNEINWSEVQK